MPPVYPEAQKDAALAIFVERGLAAAARETGIVKTTIMRWAQARGVVTVAPAKMVQARAAAEERIVMMRADLRLSLMEKIKDLMGRMDAPTWDFKGKDATQVMYPTPPAAAIQSYAVSIGILLDKFRLESGESTGRTEHPILIEGRVDAVGWVPDAPFMRMYVTVLQEAGLLDDDTIDGVAREVGPGEGDPALDTI